MARSGEVGPGKPPTLVRQRLSASTDNSLGDEESWTVIDSGTVTLPDARLTNGPVIPVVNSTPYTSYRVVFPDLKNASTASAMHVADVRFFQSSDGSGASFLAPGDAILAIDRTLLPDSD